MSDRPKVGEILLKAGIIDDFQLRSALGEQTRWGSRLGATLVKLGFVQERDLVRALASQLDLPVAVLEGKRIHKRVLDLVPARMAEHHMVIPLFTKREGGMESLFLGMEDPSNLEVLDDLAFRTGMTIKPVMVSPSELAEAIDRYYCRSSSEAGPEPGAPGAPAPGEAPAPHLAEPARDVSSGAQSSDPPVVAHAPAAEAGTAELARHWALRSEEDDARAVPQEPARGGAADESMLRSIEEYEALVKADHDTRMLVDALCQILVEKGVTTTAELEQRVRALQDASGD